MCLKFLNSVRPMVFMKHFESSVSQKTLLELPNVSTGFKFETDFMKSRSSMPRVSRIAYKKWRINNLKNLVTWCLWLICLCTHLKTTRVVGSKCILVACFLGFHFCFDCFRFYFRGCWVSFVSESFTTDIWQLQVWVVGCPEAGSDRSVFVLYLRPWGWLTYARHARHIWVR